MLQGNLWELLQKQGRCYTSVVKCSLLAFDSKEELARIKVTDMIIVEKEGITDVLLEAAQKYRIALVATAGHFVDYVKDLMKLAHELDVSTFVF